MNDLPATIYFIISSPENILFTEQSIELTPKENLKILKKELIEIRVNNEMKIQVKEYNNSFEGKNIYLYEAEFELKKEEEKIKIKLYYDGNNLISKNNYIINQTKQLFIYDESFEYDDLINFIKPNNDYIEKKYKLSYLQKFVIFKTYLLLKSNNIMPYLLEETSKIIVEYQNIEIEFLLVFFISLINNQKNFIELPNESKKIFKSIILNITKKTNFNIKKYNNKEYTEIINNIENYTNDFKEEDLSLNLFIFLLIFYQINEQNKFNEIFKKIELKNKVIKFILDHHKTFSNLNALNIKLLFDNIKNKKKKNKNFNELISLASNFNEYVKFYCLTKDYIISDKPTIKFCNCPNPDENTDIVLLKPFIEILLKNDFDFPTDHFNHLIKILEKKDYKKLNDLKEIFIKYKNEKSKIILDTLYPAIHNTGKFFIENNKFDNLEIITFIQENANKYKNYEEDYEFVRLIRFINLDEIDEKFCKKFNFNIKYYEKLFKNQYNIFLDTLIENAINFHHLNILFQIFNIQNNSKEKKKISEKLIDVYFRKKLDKDKLSNLQLSMIVGQLCKLVYDNNDVDKLINGTNKNFSEKKKKEIFVLILNRIGNELNPLIIDKLIINIAKKSENLSYNDIIKILQNLTNKEIQKCFLGKQTKKVITDNEIFNKELSDNIKLLLELIDKGFFKEDIFKNVDYIKNTKEIMNSIFKKLRRSNFSMLQMMKMHNLQNNNDNNDNNLQKRFYIIALGDESKIKILNKVLLKKIKCYVEIFEKIEEMINIFSNYLPNEKNNIINELKIKREEILKNPINKFPKKSQINNFDKLFKEAHEINIMKCSKFFIEIFEKNKRNENIEDNNDSKILNNTKNEFLNLRNLFHLNNENNVNLNFLEAVCSKIDNNEMEKEINILIKIFNIKNLNENICEKLKLLNKKKKDIEKLNKIVLLLEDFDLNEKNVQNNLKQSIDNFKSSTTLEQLIEINTNLKNLRLKILNKDLNSEETLAVIEKMYEKPELIKFILNTNIHDIHQMGEFIDDSENVYITLSDINQLETCMTFIQQLKKIIFSEEQFLDNFINIIKNNNYKDIGIKFENSSGKYNDFHELYTIHLNPNELNKEHIKKIYNSSIFNLNSSYPDYKCIVKYDINKKEFQKDFDDILDLRDIALLRKKDQREESYFEICKNFADNINDIKEILEILNKISSKGYFEEINYTIEIKNGKAIGYQINSLNKKKNLKEIIVELNHIKELQNIEVKTIYLSNPISRMVYGRQFNILYKFITNNFNDRIEFYNNIVNNILKYVTNNKNKNEFRDIENNKEESKLKKMIEDVNIYLNQLLKKNFIDLKKIYEKAIVLDKNKKGIYSHSCLSENIEKNAIYCSLILTGNFPLAQTVLYCNDSTSEEEITSFIYKSVKCEFHALFILIKPEILNIEKKNLLIELLKELYSEEPLQMVSTLLFIYVKGNKYKEIITEIEKLPEHKYFDFEEKNNKINKKFPNIEIYSSENSGLGKSTLIKNNFKKEDENNEYKYIYFPLGGDINRKEIINRLIELTNKKIALHLDLYDSNHIEIISEFLFSFLILRYYSQNENIFYYGKEIKIKVEIPNSFFNYPKLIPIIDFFETIFLTQDNKPKLIIPKDITSNTQIVCNYLKNINQINEREIYIFGVSDNQTSNCINAESLNENECSNLIYQNLNIENPNFYQIESYINIIAEQLSLFSNSIYLNVSQLNGIKQYKKNLNNIRFFFVNSLTLITKHFITSSYDNILKGQKITISQQKGKIDLEKAKEKAIEILMNKEPFSINKIKPSMILINEDGQSISEIVTCEEGTEEYNLLKAIYNSDLIDESRGVLDYRNLKPEEFLIEVKKVLDLYNPLNEYDNSCPKEMDGKKLKPLNKIVDSYIFTADNFIKLILISLRLRTNIPVIMMGETGCGKTSLIRIIAELKDITMYTLNIHAGIEDKDIIEFIEKHNLLEKNESLGIKNVNVWVFLDEINTCNSLGLITEIMIKYSCKGKKIKENVKFIAACNPYRLETKEKEIIGLCNESKHSFRKLVYTVNPLPIPLLNFVFDFGTPGKEDIKRYISSMVCQILQNLIDEHLLLSYVESIAKKAIFDAQEFIKNNFEISSVSLREVRRWGILFEWFLNLLNNSFFSENFNFSNEMVYVYSLNLSIYLCYYIRIYNKLIRKDFLNLMKNSFGKNFNFEEFPKKFQEIIAEKVDLDKGIAKNRALLENLFSIFVCLNTKIPLFIIGKPGCSKSLSAQLIFKSMNGKDSSNDFFKHFPKVYTKSYQGSLTSNSKGVLKIFKKARESLKDKKLSNEIISAIYFDEMGLAEISKNNPLKVIHSQLEYDENKEKISFIGISNWPLDASKMNRGIHLSIPEPYKEDLTETALAIAKSYDPRLIQDYKEYFEYF